MDKEAKVALGPNPAPSLPATRIEQSIGPRGEGEWWEGEQGDKQRGWFQREGGKHSWSLCWITFWSSFSLLFSVAGIFCPTPLSGGGSAS